jgi:hypothetical protein
VFFCSVIQATDSTFTGMQREEQRRQPFGGPRALARRPAPATRRSRLRTSANSTAEAACSST